MSYPASLWAALTEMYQNILFDLDGTVTESGIGITKSVAYALQKWGITEQDPQKLNRFVGPPLITSFMEYYGFTAEDAVKAVEDYREYYAVKGIFENRVYDGVVKMLETLKNQGRTCILATAKPEEYAIRILEHFDLSRYFSVVAGATMDERRTDKTSVIAYALEKAGIADRASAVMVGDREHDILGAKANGLHSIGVLYGYGSREELVNAGAEYIAAASEDILKFV